MSRRSLSCGCSSLIRAKALATNPRWSSVICGNGVSHTSSQTRSSWCSAAEWKVAAVTASPTPSLASRTRISAAAFTEKVTASVRAGSQAPDAQA